MNLMVNLDEFKPKLPTNLFYHICLNNPAKFQSSILNLNFSTAVYFNKNVNIFEGYFELWDPSCICTPRLHGSMKNLVDEN